MGTRGNTKHGCGIASLYFDSCYRNQYLGWKPISSKNLAGRPYPYPPVWLRLRHAVQAAGIGTEECQCIVIKFAATCLNEAACRAVSFAAPQPELRDAGLPGAKRRDADNRVVFFCLLCLHEQEKKVACRGETRPLSLATKLKDFYNYQRFMRLSWRPIWFGFPASTHRPQQLKTQQEVNSAKPKN